MILRLLILSAGLACAADFEWNLPKGFPRPPVPASNPMTAAKVALGRHLFYDKRLSVNGQQACAGCHRQEFAFTDAKAHAVGTTGAVHPRSSMSLANVAYQPMLTWAHPALRTLEEQALIPILGTAPVELGLAGEEKRFLDAIRTDPTYRKLFPAAFPGEANPYSLDNAVKAIAAFERTILSIRSPYDRFHRDGDKAAISDSAKRGEKLFFSERLSCGNEQCHSDWTFNGAVIVEGGQEPHIWFQNNGIYSPKEFAEDPHKNSGLREFTGSNGDLGRFRVPTLRNIAVTAPYMHDGSIATLDAVIDQYAAGGRAPNARKSPIIKGFQLTSDEKTDLLEFLRSLTDQHLLQDPQLSNPWKKNPAN